MDLYLEAVVYSGTDNFDFGFDYTRFGARNQSFGTLWGDLIGNFVGLRYLVRSIYGSQSLEVSKVIWIGQSSGGISLYDQRFNCLVFAGLDKDSFDSLIDEIGLDDGNYYSLEISLKMRLVLEGILLMRALCFEIFLEDMEDLKESAELIRLYWLILGSVSWGFDGIRRFGIYRYCEVALSISTLISDIVHKGLKFWFSFLLFYLFLRASVPVGVGVVMAQLNLNKAKVAMVRTETVKISGSLLAHRIQQFSLTLIGRLMNPSVQRMESLVANMPKIWKLEEKVVGNDLGLGKFQFNFDNEEDLLGVLQNVPYHFDGWMVSLVRWEPIIDSSHPSAISFWVKITEIPLHFWEESTICAIGKAIGEVREIDADSGSVYVTVNGFNPLLFQVVVPFDTGDEIVVSLEYEKLCGVCRHCSILTHDVAVCPELRRDAGMSREDQHNGRLVTGSSSNSQSQGGQWEKPRKPAAKKALEFPEPDSRDGFPYKKDFGDNSRHYSRRNDKHQGSLWARKTGSKGINGENSSRSEQKPVKKLTIPLEVSQVIDNAVGEPLPSIQEEAVGVVLALNTDDDTVSKEDAGIEDGEMAGMNEEALGNTANEDSMEVAGVEISDGSEGNNIDSVSYAQIIKSVNKAISGITLGTKKGSDKVVRSPKNKGIYSRKKNVVLASPGKRLKANLLKQKSVGTDNLKAKAGASAGAAKGNKNSGMGALPKPPADT